MGDERQELEMGAVDGDGGRDGVWQAKTGEGLRQGGTTGKCTYLVHI